MTVSVVVNQTTGPTSVHNCLRKGGLIILAKEKVGRFHIQVIELL